ncbi:Oligosaccharides import ATP-binding protein MsmX [subsurface metagenome]
MKDGKLQQYGTPLDIYRKPANLFVARFVGSPPINIITKESSSKLFESAVSFLRESGMEDAAERAVSIGMRPESLRINPDKESGSKESWKPEGNVAAMLPTGPEWILQIESDGIYFYCSIDSDPDFVSGDKCTLSFRKDDFLLFDNSDKLISQ